MIHGFLHGMFILMEIAALSAIFIATRRNLIDNPEKGLSYHFSNILGGAIFVLFVIFPYILYVLLTRN